MLGRKYGEVKYDKMDGAWLFIPTFDLPSGWNKSQVGVLIDIPWSTPGYPSVAPQWFWTDEDLETADGQSIGHFFTSGTHGGAQEYRDQGWGHFCVHLNEWRPASGANWLSGHSLITYLDLIRAIFHDRQTLSGG